MLKNKVVYLCKRCETTHLKQPNNKCPICGNELIVVERIINKGVR